MKNKQIHLISQKIHVHHLFLISLRIREKANWEAQTQPLSYSLRPKLPQTLRLQSCKVSDPVSSAVSALYASTSPSPLAHATFRSQQAPQPHRTVGMWTHLSFPHMLWQDFAELCFPVRVTDSVGFFLSLTLRRSMNKLIQALCFFSSPWSEGHCSRRFYRVQSMTANKGLVPTLKAQHSSSGLIHFQAHTAGHWITGL